MTNTNSTTVFRFSAAIVVLIGMLCMGSPSLRAQDEASEQEIDKKIVVEVEPGRLRFATEEFTVPAGATIKVVLDNSDGTLQHNLVLCEAGDKQLAISVAQKAWNMNNAFENDYVPDSDKVLHATSLLNPGEKESIVFTAPEQPDDYPYVCTMPGHAQTMNGIMHVKAGDGNEGNGEQNSSNDAQNENETNLVSGLSYRYYEGKWDQLPNFDELEPDKTGDRENNKISLDPRERDDYFGFVFTGTLTIPATGTYTFNVRSDDGSRIQIDGETVVSYDGVHAATENKTGSVDLDAGEHELRIEYFEASGNQSLEAGMTGSPIDRRVYFNPTPFMVSVEKEPKVFRVLMPDAPPRSIAVGLPGGIHYCYDATKGFVRYAWSGGFLNVGPERGNGKGRGGKTCRPMGTRFDVGTADAQPLRIGTPDREPDVEFLGYKRGDGAPVMMFSVNGLEVHQRVTPASDGRGIQVTYQLKKSPNKAVYYVVQEEGVDVSASKGEWQDQVLQLPSGTTEFSVTILNQAK